MVLPALDWSPDAELAALRARARLYADIRAYFGAHGVMEVDTPVLSAHATVDRHIDSFSTTAGRWLQTSPEFAMKRLLAAGSGPIWQIAHVFRVEELGRHHNPEFTLLEWYRPGWDHRQLMDEVEALLRAAGLAAQTAFGRLSYREAFLKHAQVDPFSASVEELRQGLFRRGLAVPEDFSAQDAHYRDFWLDLWMSLVVGPRLGVEVPVFVYDFPASQAALARIRPGTPAVAERFEVFWRGIELANGFHELLDAGEQQARFEADQEWRRQRGLAVPPCDLNLIAALEAGLPPCAGVAIGLDRLLMMMLGLPDVAKTMAFAWRKA